MVTPLEKETRPEQKEKKESLKEIVRLVIEYEKEFEALRQAESRTFAIGTLSVEGGQDLFSFYGRERFFKALEYLWESQDVKGKGTHDLVVQCEPDRKKRLALYAEMDTRTEELAEKVAARSTRTDAADQEEAKRHSRASFGINANNLRVRQHYTAHFRSLDQFSTRLLAEAEAVLTRRDTIQSLKGAGVRLTHDAFAGDSDAFRRSLELYDGGLTEAAMERDEMHEASRETLFKQSEQILRMIQNEMQALEQASLIRVQVHFDAVVREAQKVGDAGLANESMIGAVLGSGWAQLAEMEKQEQERVKGEKAPWFALRNRIHSLRY